MANQLVKINGRNLYDGLGTGANFETLSISGRGLAPTRDRQLQFPGDVGARDYGSLPDVRRITISGILHANTINQFTLALDELKEACRSRLKVDEILYGEVEAQTLWFADESVIIGPYTCLGGILSGADWSSFVLDSDIPSRYSSGQYSIIGTGNTGLKMEFLDSADPNIKTPAVWDIIAVGPDHGSAPADSTTFYLAPAGGVDAVGDTAWIRDDRYYLVNYSGTMNEERLTRQWFAHGFANITLPFKAVYPFAVSEVKTTEFTPNATNGYFKSINTGTAPTYPVYRIKGEANTPTIVEATHSLVWNANDNNATNILGESVSATVSAAGFYGQTGKLNQAIAFDTNQDKTQGDSVSITNANVRNGMGIGSALNSNQGSVGFWFKKPGGYEVLPGEYEFFFYTDLVAAYRYRTTSQHTFYFQVADKYLAATISTSSPELTAGNWYYFIGRWDVRRVINAGANYAEFQIYNTSGSSVLSGTSTTDPANSTSISDLSLGAHGTVTTRYFAGLIDDLAIWDRPLTDTERNTLVNSGTGVRADTVASSELVYYSDFDQTVGTTFTAAQLASSNMDTAQVSATTTTTATVGGYGDKIFPGTDRFVLYDETGYKVQSTVATSADTSITYASLTDADKVGVYAYMGGTGDYMQPASIGVCDVTTGDFSLSFWMNRTDTDDLEIIYNKSGGGGGVPFWQCYIYNGKVRGVINDGVAAQVMVESTVVVTDGKWHNIVIVWDRSANIEMYIDGVLDTWAVISAATATLTNGLAFTVGNAAWVASLYNYGGNIRDLAFWDSVIHSADALTLATNPIDGVATVGGAVNHWMMNEAWTTSMYNSGTGTDTLGLYGTGTTRTQLAYISKNLIADGGMENGGIGGAGSIYPGVGQVVQKSTSTVKKDAQSLKSTGTAAWALWDSAAIAVAAGEDYVLRYWIKQEVQQGNIGMYDNTGATVIYGHYHPVNSDFEFFESAFEAPSGCVSMSVRDYHTASAGSGGINYLDDLKLLPNLVDNGGMEGAYSSGVAPGNWSESGSISPAESADEHSGTKAQEFSPGTGYANSLRLTSISFVANEFYELSFWAKRTSGSGNIQINKSDYSGIKGTFDGWSMTSSYARYSTIFQMGSDLSGSFWFHGSDSSSTFILDDVAVVHRPDLSVSFNNMTNGYRFEPTRLTRGYKTGGNEQYYFGSQVINPSEFTIRAVIRPQFPSTNVGDRNFVLGAYSAGTNKLSISYTSTSKFLFDSYDSVSSTRQSSSPVMNFAQDEEIEVGWAFDSSGSRVYINGSGAGATNNATGTAFPAIMNTVRIGKNAYIAEGDTGNYIIDDLEILAKSQPAEWFAEQHAKRNAAKFENLKAVYASTLDAGDILTLDSNTTKVIARAKLWDASASTDTDALTNMTINQSKMPILSPTKSMLYFPNSIPSGVEIYYRNNFQ